MQLQISRAELAVGSDRRSLRLASPTVGCNDVTIYCCMPHVISVLPAASFGARTCHAVPVGTRDAMHYPNAGAIRSEPRHALSLGGSAAGSCTSRACNSSCQLATTSVRQLSSVETLRVSALRHSV